MTATFPDFPDFPDVDPLGVDVIGARPGKAPGTEAEAIEIALQPPGEDPEVFSLSIHAAYELREALDDALEAPFWWEEDPDHCEDRSTLALKADGAMRAPSVIDLDARRSVRWDEDWASSPLR